MLSRIAALSGISLFSLGLLLQGCTSPSHNSLVLREHVGPLPVSRNPTFAALNLVDIREVDPTIQVDLYYKTGKNITGAPLYPADLPPLLTPGTARRLAFANRLVAKQGFYLKIWDAYRPPRAQRALYEASGRNDLYVANPDNAPSQHSCGTAVDLTLVRQDGREAKMPTGMDAFTQAAASDYQHPDPEVRRNLAILQRAMSDAGFYPLPAEWWHYIDRDYKKFPQTISLEQLQPSL